MSAGVPPPLLSPVGRLLTRASGRNECPGSSVSVPPGAQIAPGDTRARRTPAAARLGAISFVRARSPERCPVDNAALGEHSGKNLAGPFCNATEDRFHRAESASFRSWRAAFLEGVLGSFVRSRDARN